MKSLLYLLAIVLTITIFSAKGYTEPIVTDGLVSYWTFDRRDIDGDTVKDVWGENDGKIVGARRVGGRVNDALEFDGTDDYVNLTNLSDFGSQVGTSTFEVWVKTSLKKEHWTTLFKVRDEDCSMGWGIDLNAWTWHPNFPDHLPKIPVPLAENPIKNINQVDNTVFTKDVIRLYLTNAIRLNKLKPLICKHSTFGLRFPISDGEWHHLVYINGMPYVDENGHEWRGKAIFIDGKQNLFIRRSVGMPDNFMPFTEPVYLGAGNNRGVAERFYNGIIDEVRIYDRPLTADEVTRNFESKVGWSVEATEKLPVVWGALKTAL